jgi:hypothetical protein
MKKVVQLFSELILLANNTSPAKKLVKEDSDLITLVDLCLQKSALKSIMVMCHSKKLRLENYNNVEVW